MGLPSAKNAPEGTRLILRYTGRWVPFVYRWEPLTTNPFGNSRLIEALALNGSVPALASLHAIAEKFKDNTRRKFAVVGQAAQESVEKAARRLKALS